MNPYQPNEDIFARYFAGELSPAEERDLLDWVQEHPDHEVDFEQYRGTWQVSQKALQPRFDVDAAWRRVKHKAGAAEPEIQPSAHRSKMPWLRIAAVLAVLLTVGIALWFPFASEDQKIVRSGEQSLDFYLPDSTHVVLKPRTELRYAEQFEPRTVSMDGTASFHVKRQGKSLFTVAAPHGEVQVLGTRFIVETNSSQTQVKVQSGKVRVRNKEGAQKDLLPGMKALLEEGNSGISVSEVTPESVSWEFDKTLVFSDTDLQSVVKVLESVFNQKIILSNEKIGNCRLTATFHNQDLVEILNIISVTFELQLNAGENQFRIDGEGC